MIDFRNINSVWAGILVQTLKRLGLITAVICPGSRSTPLSIAFAQTEGLEAIPVLDERSAAFFALGIAKVTHRPVALVCTSGTAGANFYPAVIEARCSRVPLLVLTADRPPELRDCHSGQTIDQVKLFGTYPNWQAELAPAGVEMEMLSYLRQTVIHSWERSLYPVPGPIHLNIPLREPLAPAPGATELSLATQLQLEEFLVGVAEESWGASVQSGISPRDNWRRAGGQLDLISEWQECERGVIVVGPSQSQMPQEYCRAIGKLAKVLGWPVLADGLSPLRNYAQLNPGLISTYDLILRNQELANYLAPKMVIQLSELPTSKELRAWLHAFGPRRWVIDLSDQNLDPLHGKTTNLRISIEQLVHGIFDEDKPLTNYFQLWRAAEAKVRANVDEAMLQMNQLFEGKAAWLLSQILPAKTPIFIANSMPVRDVEFFWSPSNSAIQPVFNRGANGIDGTLSSALGMAHRHQSCVVLTGDLALLHDTNGFLLRNKFVGHLTVVLINNNGGGIFETLPIAKFDPPFEEFFATPQDINFADLCATYGIEHELIHSWEQMRQKLNPLPQQGIRVLELQCDRKADAQWRRKYLAEFAADIQNFIPPTA